MPTRKKKPAVKKRQPVKETFPHFRYYKKSGHPALITAEYSEKEYKYRKATHSDREGRHLNEKLEPNPNPADKKPMYLVKRERHDKKKYFGERLPWKSPRKKER